MDQPGQGVPGSTKAGSNKDQIEQTLDEVMNVILDQSKSQSKQAHHEDNSDASGTCQSVSSEHRLSSPSVDDFWRGCKARKH